MGEKKKDKRRSSWALRKGVVSSIRECFTSDAAMFSELGTNAKTGAKLLDREPIKRDVMKNAVTRFLDFLSDVNEKSRAIDSGKHAEGDIKKAIAKYVVPDLADWKDLAQDINDAD